MVLLRPSASRISGRLARQGPASLDRCQEKSLVQLGRRPHGALCSFCLTLLPDTAPATTSSSSEAPTETQGQSTSAARPSASGAPQAARICGRHRGPHRWPPTPRPCSTLTRVCHRASSSICRCRQNSGRIFTLSPLHPSADAGAVSASRTKGFTIGARMPLPAGFSQCGGADVPGAAALQRRLCLRRSVKPERPTALALHNTCQMHGDSSARLSACPECPLSCPSPCPLTGPGWYDSDAVASRETWRPGSGPTFGALPHLPAAAAVEAREPLPGPASYFPDW